jgi:uncharacterized protein
MRLARATVCLPTKNRRGSHAFYTALGFAAVGELADDGLPEPLQFVINAGLRVMMIPTVGFGWMIGGRKRSPRGAHECQVLITVANEAAVDELMRRAKDAGAKIVFKPGSKEWGHAGAFTDPDRHMWQVIPAGGFLAR